MDNIRLHKEKIKDIAYIATSVAITIILVIGVFLTKDRVFPYSIVAQDIFWMTLPYIIIVFLAVQMVGVVFIGKVRKYFMSFTAISLSTFLAFQCVFATIALPRNIPPNHGMTIFSGVVVDLFYPSGLVWVDYGSDTHWLYPNGYPLIFIFLATAFLTAFEYFWLHKRTEKKKALFFTILITSFVLCTAVSIIMKINY